MPASRVDITIRYVFPARLDDLLTVFTKIQDIRFCTFAFVQTVRHQQDQLICEATVQTVCVNKNLKPKKLPDIIKEIE